MTKKKLESRTEWKALTKAEIYAQIAADTGLSRKDVAAVFESLSSQIEKNLSGRGAPGVFQIPGLLKMRAVQRPATKARKGINPFTGEEIVVKGKGVSRAVRITPLKGLKSMVSGGHGDEGGLDD